MAEIPAKTLLKIARDIGGNDQNLLALGLELGFTETVTNQYIATNKGGASVTADGTTSMIFDWSKKTAIKDQVRILRKALEDDFKAVADKWLPTAEGSEPSASSSSGQSNATGSGGKVTPDQINKLLDDFPGSKYHTFCNKLINYSHNRAEAILLSKNNDSRAALASVLADWKSDTGGHRDKLEEALRASHAGGLIDNIFD